LEKVDSGDVILYQIIAAILIGALGFAGARFGGHFYRERQAHTIETMDRKPGPEGDHEAALNVSRGYKDTQAYLNTRSALTVEDMNGAYVELSMAEKYQIYIAIAAAVIGFLASHEAARIQARKKASQGRINKMGTQRFQNPRG
jgi:hypothetical protein